jgi:hypothetical protein
MPRPTGAGLLEELAAGLFGDGLLHFQPGKFGHGGFAFAFVGQSGEVGALGGGLFLQGDFLGEDARLGHDAEAYGVTGGDEGVAGAVGEGFAFALEVVEFALGAGGGDLAFGEFVEPGHLGLHSPM